jgi:hypothetical protein
MADNRIIRGRSRPEIVAPARVLVAEHFRLAPYGQVMGALKREVDGEDQIAIYSVSGSLIDLFDDVLWHLDPNWGMVNQNPAIDVKPAVDVELRELRKIAELPERKGRRK